MKIFFRVIFLNIFIFFCFIGILFFIPPTVHKLYEIFIKKESYNHLYKSKLPNYQNISWAKQHFKEFSILDSEYYDYYVWRRANFTGETINIKDGLRKTVQPSKINNKVVLWFFGGSTMWGTGVDDQNTLPSLIAKDTNFQSINFGESGYTSTQQLAYLNNLYIVGKNHSSKKKIFFLDGVNDVIKNCKSDINNIETYYQKLIRKTFDNNLSANSLSYKSTFKQWIVFIEKIRLYFNLNPEIPIETAFDCHINDSKAKNVANFLIETWINAKAIIEARGDEFIPILQPNAFVGNSDLSHINLKNIYELQYKKVYPLIKKIAKEKNIEFIDLSNIFKKDDLVYIDWCHLSPNGNIILKNAIMNTIN